MMSRLENAACFGVFLCTFYPLAAYGISVSCMMVYEEGGAPAVFSSPECHQWFSSVKFSQNTTRICQSATLQGLREYQEDRITCNLDMKLPFSGKNGHEEVSVGVAAIFDGHGGQEASELASKKLLDYLSMHVTFTEYKLLLPIYINDDEAVSLRKAVMSHQGKSPTINYSSTLHEVLEEALLRTIKDLDSEFSQEALEKGYASGCTGIVVLLVNDELLIANIGDSKAFLCSKRSDSAKILLVEELTRDHHPDREDEKGRIIAAGGFVSWWGVPRVNGILAISRAIGDVPLKRYGVIAEPEVTGWRHVTPENRYLVVASDGLFEVFTPQNVCDLLHDKASKSSSESIPSKMLAEWITQTALKAGSTDNLSTVLISLDNDTANR